MGMEMGGSLAASRIFVHTDPKARHDGANASLLRIWRCPRIQAEIEGGASRGRVRALYSLPAHADSVLDIADPTRNELTTILHSFGQAVTLLPGCQCAAVC